MQIVIYVYINISTQYNNVIILIMFASIQVPWNF